MEYPVPWMSTPRLTAEECAELRAAMKAGLARLPEIRAARLARSDEAGEAANTAPSEAALTTG